MLAKTEQKETKSIIKNAQEVSLALSYPTFLHAVSDLIPDMQTVLLLQSPDLLGAT